MGTKIFGKLPKKPKYKLKKKQCEVNAGKSDGYVTKGLGPKAGSAGGEGAKKAFSNKVKDQARKESNDTCVFCGTKTTEEFLNR